MADGKIIGAAVAAILLLGAPAASADALADYEAGLRAAAVVTPAFQVRLAIPPAGETVEVVSFARPDEIPVDARGFEVWVSLPRELRNACAGAANPALRLQQVLGLPYQPTNNVIKTLSVKRASLFRPCLGGGGLDDSQCGLGRIPPLADNATAEEQRRLYFLASQVWDSHRQGFARTGAVSGAYPYGGFPFTGMGWTYDWSPANPSHVGVAEFVVPRDAAVTTVGVTSPADFCR
ncbi:hypothetical protein [Phaeospirillum tilakii]|uniref:Uncharacterized protein n=1 Tax=Phaeospirillum tilakii TaxID=741673 RepID=A0ABW5CCV9_9PROT